LKTDTTEWTKILYSIDPSCQNNFEPSNSFTILHTKHIYARAYKTGLTPSGIKDLGTIIIKVPTPEM